MISRKTDVGTGDLLISRKTDVGRGDLLISRKLTFPFNFNQLFCSSKYVYVFVLIREANENSFYVTSGVRLSRMHISWKLNQDVRKE